MDNANQIINKKNQNCVILNCFEVEKEKEKLEEILDRHDKVVNTSGEKYPEEIFIEYTPKVYKKITV